MATAKVSKSGEKVAELEGCIICCHTSDFYIVGACNHPICYECSTRLRVICDNKDCPVCRMNLPTVLMVDCEDKSYCEYTPAKFVRHKRGDKVGVLFVNPMALDVFCDILAHVCTMCKNEVDFSTFVELERHMRREHGLHYCDLCTKHLNLFSWERKCYSRQDLVHHRRQGDPDDRSHRGHPPCEFCDERFMDPDHLFLHLRRDHYFCHFCDADGENKFYDTYDVLRFHFKECHYLCLQGNCENEQFTSVFRSEIDLKAHQLSAHSKDKKRQDRVIAVDINYSNSRPGPQGFRGSFGGRAQGPRANNENSAQRGQGRGPGRGAQGARNQGPPRPTIPGYSEPEAPSHQLIPLQSETGKGGSKISTVLRVPTSQPEATGANGAAESRNERKEDTKFAMEKADFPSLLGGENNSKHAAMGKKGWRLGRTMSGSLDEQDFPVLGGEGGNSEMTRPLSGMQMRPKQAPRTEKAERAVREEGRKKEGLVMIDDDEMFPSLAKMQLQEEVKSREMKPAPAKPVATNENTVESEVPTKKSFYEQMNSGGWKNKPPSLGQAVMCLDDSSNFPSLQSNKQKIKGFGSGKAWSKVANPNGNAITGAVINNKSGKEKDLPTPEEWPSAAPVAAADFSAAGPNQENRTNFVKLPKTKSKARRVAQRQQRTSISSSQDDPSPPDLDMPPGFGAPPPGSAGGGPPSTEAPSAGGPDAPPPGFEGYNLSHDTFAYSQYSNTYSFVKPTGFSERNANLFVRIEAVVQKDSVKIDDFKTHSTMFRRGDITANGYYDKMEEILGPETCKIVPELLCLLPDIHRQRSLLSVYTHRKEKSGRKTGRWTEMEGRDGLDTCAICGQVLMKIDVPEHATSHTYQYSEFPQLS